MTELVVHIPLEHDHDVPQGAPVIDARDAPDGEPGIVIDDGIPLSYDCSICGRALVSGDAGYWLAGVRIRCVDCGAVSLVPCAPRPARLASRVRSTRPVAGAAIEPSLSAPTS